MIKIPQEYLQCDAIQEAATMAIQTPRLIEIISILIDKAEKEREEERALDGATESLIARLRTLLYGLDIRAKSLSDRLYEAGYKQQLDIGV